MLSQIQDDRRMFARFSARFPAKFKDARADYGSVIGLRDASAGGVKIFSRERLYLNDTVTIEVRLPDTQAPLNIKGQVVWSKKNEPSLWEFGLQCHTISLVSMSRLYKFVVDN